MIFSDFFVNWGNYSISNEAWHKVLWDVDESLKIDNSDFFSLKKQLMNLFGEKRLNDDYHVLRKMDMYPNYVLIPDIKVSSWENDLKNNYVYIYTPEILSSSGKINIYNTEQLINKINGIRNSDSTQMGNKGMKYSTSSLEGFLSRGKTIWPGDVDILMYDNNKCIPKAMFEIKKHTNRDYRKLSDLSISDYTKRDIRKYGSLYLFSRKYNLPFYMIFYSTNISDKCVYIERVDTNVNSSIEMYSKHKINIDLPQKDNEYSYKKFYENVLVPIFNGEF